MGDAESRICSVYHGGLSHRLAHSPILVAVDNEVRVAIPRPNSVARPGLHDAGRTYQTDEGFELANEIQSPVADGVLVGPLRHRFRELPANSSDVANRVIESESHGEDATRPSRQQPDVEAAQDQDYG